MAALPKGIPPDATPEWVSPLPPSKRPGFVHTSGTEPGNECAMTRRSEELQDLIDHLRAALKEAEDALRLERLRKPEVGDYVRCPLTNFFGKVTKVTPRPHGRPWVEIAPYLADDLVAKGSLSLFDSWELIDAPREDERSKPFAGRVPLPPIESISWPSRARRPPARYIVRRGQRLGKVSERAFETLPARLPPQQ